MKLSPPTTNEQEPDSKNIPVCAMCGADLLKIDDRRDHSKHPYWECDETGYRIVGSVLNYTFEGGATRSVFYDQ